MKKAIFLAVLIIFAPTILFAASGEGSRSSSNIPKEVKMKKASARHILVSSKEECEDLKAQIEKGADFSKVAKEHSKCPSGKKGGDLGEFAPGQMVKEFDVVVFSADLNKVQGPVKTDFGYHLIEVTSRTE